MREYLTIGNVTVPAPAAREALAIRRSCRVCT